MQSITLYGGPHSMYTTRARSCLIKAGIPFRERAPGSKHFRIVVVPEGGGRHTLPTIGFENGDVIRDNASIADYFEPEFGHSFTPLTPKQYLISALFGVVGAEGLYRPALHFRRHSRTRAWTSPDIASKRMLAKSRVWWSWS
jgi:glutathione S-transferase